MTPAETPRRIHLLTALLLGGTFLAGALSGAGVLRWLSPPIAASAQPALALPPPLPAARLPRELHLTAAQEASAREIGERYRPELEALAREIRPKVRAVQDRMEGEFLQLLTPDQRLQLGEIEARRRFPPKQDEPVGAKGPPPPAGGVAPHSVQGPPPGPAADGPAGRRPPPQEAIDACLHLDQDQLCRFIRNGREREGSCRHAPGGGGPLHCAPDRHLEPPPPEGRQP